MKFVAPKDLPVMTARPPGWIERSAISGLPMTMVVARSGTLMTLAWSSRTTIGSSALARDAMTATERMAANQNTGRSLARPRTHNAVIDTLRNATRIRRPKEVALTPVQLTAN